MNEFLNYRPSAGIHRYTKSLTGYSVWSQELVNSSPLTMHLSILALN